MKPNDFSDIFNNDSTNICSAINVDPQFSNMIFGCDPSVKPDNIPSNVYKEYDMTKFKPTPTPTTSATSTPTPKPTIATVPTKPKIKSKYPLEIFDDTTPYNLLGYATNEYYNQYYLIYESEVKDMIKNQPVNNDSKFLKVKLYKYVLVRMDKNIPHIIHKVGARNKINLNDFVYLSYGVFQLGPFRISEIK
jgi:hypothetical protein